MRRHVENQSRPSRQRPDASSQRPDARRQRPSGQRSVASVAPRRLHWRHGGLPLPPAASGCHAPRTAHHAPRTAHGPLPPLSPRYDNAPGAEHKCCKTGTGLARLVGASWTIVSKHLGSLAVGAFVIALCQTLRLGMKLLDNMTQKARLPCHALPCPALTRPHARSRAPSTTLAPTHRPWPHHTLAPHTTQHNPTTHLSLAPAPPHPRHAGAGEELLPQAGDEVHPVLHVVPAEDRRVRQLLRCVRVVRSK